MKDYKNLDEQGQPIEHFEPQFAPEEAEAIPENQSGDIKDDVKVASNSRLSQKKQTILYGIAILILFGLLYSFFSGGHNGHVKNANDTLGNQNAASDQQDQSVLDATISKLNQPSQLAQAQNEAENQAQQAESASPGVIPMNSALGTNIGSSMDTGNSQQTSQRLSVSSEVYCSGGCTSGASGSGSDGVSSGAGQNGTNGSPSTSGLSGGTDAYSSFANNQSSSTSSVSGTQIQHPNWTIVQGEMIHANLETAIDSDLPGMVRAVVSTPVYSYSNDNLLIPSGSRLIGQYATAAGNGGATSRVFIVWNRIVTPNGISVMINSPSADALGQAGSGADDIDHHFWQIFGTGFLFSILGAEASTAGVSPSTQLNSANQLQGAVGQSLNQTAQTMLQGNQNISPTLYINQGSAVNVFVSHDLDLYGVLGAQTNNEQ